MKLTTVLVSFAIGAAAQSSPNGVGNIRAARALSDHQQESAVIDKFSALSRGGGKDATAAAARHERSRRKIAGEDLHKTIIKNMDLATNMKTIQDVVKVDVKEDRDLAHKVRNEKGREEKDDDRKLKKTKSDKDGIGNGSGKGHGKGGNGNGGGGEWVNWDDDNWIGNSGNWNGGSGDWNRGSDDHSGGSGDRNIGSGDWNTEVYAGKAGKNNRSGSYSGSGKSGKEISSGDEGESCSEYAYVQVTNLSYEQSFSEIFIMTATEHVTEYMPLYVFGNRTNLALASLSQDADASEMQNRYMNRKGVEMVKIFDEFEQAGEDEKFLRGGAMASFKVHTSGYGERLTIAVGLPFTNDGAVILQGAHIYDGAEYFVPPIDSGAEANIQTCWSVAAKREDFPPRSVCADSDNTSENANDIPGENYVSMHRGLHDIDNESDLQDLLQLVECDEQIIDENSNQRFSTYFYELGYDDDFLLCSNAFGTCDPRDDQDFINTLQDLDDLSGDRYVELARESKDFDDFCANITAVNEEINDLFKTLEPWIFDWRNEIMHVKVSCGWHDDGWSNGAGYQNITTLPERLN